MSDFKWPENVIMKVELEAPTGDIIYLAVTYDLSEFQLLLWDETIWVSKWVNMHDWKTITDRLRREIEELIL